MSPIANSFDVNVSLKDVADFTEGGNSADSSKYPVKFAMHKLEAKPSTLQVKFQVFIVGIMFHINKYNYHIHIYDSITNL